MTAKSVLPKKKTAAKKVEASSKVLKNKNIKSKAPAPKAVKQKTAALRTSSAQVSAKKAPAKAAASQKAAPVVKTVKTAPIATKLAPVAAKITKTAPKMAAKPVQAAPMRAEKVEKTDKKPENKFKVGNYVVYPTHGVGRIISEETQKIGDIELRVFVITFEKDKMTLRVPVNRAAAAGLRNISGRADLDKAFFTLKGRARTSRGMWSRRAQEYEAKINSGSIIAVAEVVRDLHKNVDQAERSYSERMIYETALGRLVGEIAAAHEIDSKEATDKLMVVLKKQAA